MEVPLSPKRLLSKTCRTCMCKEKDGDQLLQSIFEYPGRDQTILIADLLTTTTPQLTINRNDRLPKEICSQCLSRALNIHEFQQMCIRSDQHMRSIFELDDREGREKVSSLPKANEQMPCNQPVEDPLRRIALDETLNTNFESELNDCLKLELHIDDENYMYEGGKEDKTKTRPIHVKSEGDSKTPDSSTTSAAIVSDGTDCKTDDSDASEHSDWEQENKRKTSRPKKLVTAEPNYESSSQVIKEGCDEEKPVTKRRRPRCRKDSFACPKCGKQFDRTYGLSRHMNVHDAAGKPYECSQCQYRFKTKSLLMSHGVCHTVPTSKSRQYSGKSEGYKCSYCPRRFVKRHSLSLHIQSHLKADVDSNESANMKQQGYNCRLCEETFDARPELIAHLNTHNIVKPYVCEYCNKAFQQSCTLKDHIRTHTGEQPFLCSECGRAFNSSSNMKQHLLRHTGEKRYECPECPKKFPCLSDLASHMAVHKKIKPHICDICGAAFGKPYQLKKHKMYHNGEKPHKCEYCEMRFVCADHMRRHMRTHTGEKPYKCKYCERAFTQSNDLVKHLRTHVGENVYTCELCPKAFRLAAELRKHFAQHKNDNADAEMEEQNMRTNEAISGSDNNVLPPTSRDAIESST